ncbi:hypothetical protein AU468_08800 [Alkalispirochaeta sphaeroplastigenens]|uniref:Uncharacterized protein n=1 Tax=Alkalispirochaeta sphaeroplastigenens TaxID=1187066 RepID=A0A2S4JNA6_9SPIO|nr:MULTISPECIES: efflux RND transporter periplasmic adaptor subunit [Alkalispirochaeta]POR00960.1 hypothetical protein AU468_08800 [Alkalispirochaeta sphaeroplastigenens]
MKKFSLLTVFAVPLALALAGCSGNGNDITETPRPVRWQYAADAQETLARSFVGRTRSGSEARVSPKVAGMIQEILVDVGDDVQVGDLIARIDPEPLQLQRDAAATQLAGAQAQASAARATYNRVRNLYQQELASRQDYDAARASAESAEAAVNGAQRQLELADLQLSYARVTSPFSGRVSARVANAGENIAVGHPIVLIVSQDRWEVTLSVPDSVVATIETGNPAEVVVSAQPGEVLTGTVSGVGGGAAAGAGTFPVTVRLHQAPEWMRAGMVSRVQFPRAAQWEGAAVRVPSSAVAQDRDGHFLYVIEPVDEKDEHGADLARLKRVSIAIGRLLQDEVEILEGVESGQRVVTLGLNHISDGMLVRILPEMEGGTR